MPPESKSCKRASKCIELLLDITSSVAVAGVLLENLYCFVVVTHKI